MAIENIHRELHLNLKYLWSHSGSENSVLFSERGLKSAVQNTVSSFAALNVDKLRN